MALAALGHVIPSLADKAELARIGRYCAESMHVLNAIAGPHDAEATPSYGTDTLGDFYARFAKEGLAGPAPTRCAERSLQIDSDP